MKLFFCEETKMGKVAKVAHVLGAMLSFEIMTTYAYAGNESGNGGDTVECLPGEGNQFVGYFNLDFLLTFKAKNNNSDVVEPKSWQDSSARIQKILDNKLSVAAPLFSGFVANIDNETDYSKGQIWEESSFGLVGVGHSDPRYQLIDRMVPKNCYHQNENGEIRLIRTVTRTKKLDTTVYAYDSQILGKKLAPLQQSFLYVHEWLRDFTDDELVIRRANRVLHSTLTEAEDFSLEETLKKIGIHFERQTSLGFVPVCERTSAVRSAIERSRSKACENVTTDDLQSFYDSIDLRDMEVQSIQPGDFSGIERLHWLNLSHNQISRIDSGVFLDIGFVGGNSRSPASLDLSYNRVKKLVKNSFRGLKGDFLILDLSNNLIEELQDGAIHNKFFIKSINLSNNKLAVLNERAFADTKVASLILNDNQLKDLPSSSEFKRLIDSMDTLDLAGNQFSSISPELIAIFNSRPHLRIDLSRNPLNLEWRIYLRKTFGSRLTMEDTVSQTK
jgi:hypothetical protein